AVALLFVAPRSAESTWLRLTSEGQDAWYRASVEAPPRLALAADQQANVRVGVKNTGRVTWDSNADPPVLLSYHWLQSESDRVVAFEGLRTAFAEPVPPGETALLDARVRAPQRPGDYRLVWDLVQENRLWFDTEPGGTPNASLVTVSGRASD